MSREGIAKFFGAFAILCGTIIGVGLFGLPYVASQAGFPIVVLYLAWGTFVALLAALMFGELMYRTPGEHRLPGYVAMHLGRRWGRWVMGSSLIGLFGAQLVYLLVGGHFLAALARPVWPLPEWVWVVSYAGAGAACIAGSGRRLARSELILLPIFFGVMALVVARVLPFVAPAALVRFRPSQAILPYGVVMFSLWGLSAVAECREYLGRRYAGLLRPVVAASFIVCAVAYLAFTGAILGATQSATSPEALNGLRLLMGPDIVVWFYVFGVLTTFTSYISFGLTLKKIFVYDARLPTWFGWAAAVTVPPAFYGLGVTNFIALMGLVGAVTLGFDAISLLLAYGRAARQPATKLPYRLKLTAGTIYALAALLGIGIISTLAHFVYAW